MKLQIASDLHLEYAPDWELPAGDADVLVLAGDVGTHTLGEKALQYSTRKVGLSSGRWCRLSYGFE